MFRFQGNGILITVPDDVFDITRDIMRHARPAEGCALLFGHAGHVDRASHTGYATGAGSTGNVPSTLGCSDGETMAGDAGPLAFHVLEIVPVENVLGSPSAFEIDPVVQYREIKEHESRGLDLVGILHTHPGAQFVSSTDERYMKNAARFYLFCWLIAGDSGGRLEIGAYVVVDDEIVSAGVIRETT